MSPHFAPTDEIRDQTRLTQEGSLPVKTNWMKLLEGGGKLIVGWPIQAVFWLEWVSVAEETCFMP
jgi:hypothetical protein